MSSFSSIDGDISLYSCNLIACCIFDNVKKKIILFYAGQPEVSEMAAYIKEKLPRYMVPNVIRALEAMPFTPNGKIDRNLLKSMYEK